MRGRSTVVMAFLLVLGLGVAHATHPGSYSGYELIGFSADGKYVYFKKTMEYAIFKEEWMAVYDAATTKLKTSQPILRLCGDEGDECEDGKKAIKKAVGDRTVATLHKKYGAPTPLLTAKTKADQNTAVKDAKAATGYTQTFTAADVEVKTVSKLVGKLRDPNDDKASAAYEVQLTATIKGVTKTAKQKLRATPTENEDNGNVYEWTGLFVQGAAIAPDGRAIAFVFGHKPYVLKLNAAP